MDEKGIIVCAEEIDEGLELQLWTRGKTPRLVIVNRAKNTKKMSPLSWLEGEERKLSLKGTGGKTVHYPMEVLEEPVRRMLYRFAQDPVFKGLLWHSVLFLSDLFHTPRSVFDKSEMALLPEGKRWCLWLADFTDGGGQAFFRTFFPLSEAEMAVFGGESSVPIAGGKSLADLKKMGITRKLASVCPERWYETPQTAAAAVLLGFSMFFEESGDFSSFLWKAAEGGMVSRKALSESPADPSISRFTVKMAGYVRHWAALDSISMETVLDSFDTMKERGFARKRRMQFPVGALGNVEYTVTLYSDGKGAMAVGCVPGQATDRHRGERVFTLPEEVYGQALRDDSFGGAEDDFFTLSALLQAKLYEGWHRRIRRFTDVFLSPGG